MASKRSAGDLSTGASDAPPSKKKVTNFQQVKISCDSMEEMDIKVLQFQNKKLAERIEQRRKAENELRKRIEQLEQRQTTDDAVLCIVNRYWNQLDEDVRVILQRFDAEGADESEQENEGKAVTSFLMLLSQWDKQEIEDKLHQRVEFSKRSIGKLLQAYDRLLQRNEKMRIACKDKLLSKSDSSDDDVKKEDEEKTGEIKKEENDEDTKVKVESEKEEKVPIKEEVKVKDEPEGSEDAAKESKESNDVKPTLSNDVAISDEKLPKIDDILAKEIDELHLENKRLHNLITEIHQKNHELKIKNSETSDKSAASETEAAELKNKMEDLEYNLANALQKIDKYDRQLGEAVNKISTYEEGGITVSGGGEGVSKNKFVEISKELEEQKELATNRLTELERIQKDHQEAVKIIEALKMDISALPEHVIVETTDYKCLQSQFSVLYNESLQMKTQLEETRNLLQSSKNHYLRQIEEMEGAEVEGQKKLRNDFIQLEDQLGHVRHECESLRTEYEQILTANEQTGPINREMRNLITSLKNHNEQLKGEVARYKKKLEESHLDILKLKNEQKKSESSHLEKDDDDNDSAIMSIISNTDEPLSLRREEEEKEEKEREKGKTDGEIIKDLKQQLKKSQDSQKEMKLLLDMYKSFPKESRDKVQLMAAEKKCRHEIDELKNHIRHMQETERKEKRKLAEEDALRKIKKMEESTLELQNKLTAQKQEEEALLNEMEVTGQAYEDMQEQNIRLVQHLKEKDDANFKLMSERIKSNQIHKLLREEKEVLAEQVTTLMAQVNAQNQVVRKLEEKERILQNNLATVEKELALRTQASELHKRKAVENSQNAADLKLHLDKYHTMLKEAQNIVGDKTANLQAETFKHKRIDEEIASLRRKLERAKKIESSNSVDEVLMEEIREYKEQLTCPSCKVKKKDALLTKCFHVFCLDCLKTRYETRQRKCPKCNATFGANDFHRLYLT